MKKKVGGRDMAVAKEVSSLVDKSWQRARKDSIFSRRGCVHQLERLVAVRFEEATSPNTQPSWMPILHGGTFISFDSFLKVLRVLRVVTELPSFHLH